MFTETLSKTVPGVRFYKGLPGECHRCWRWTEGKFNVISRVCQLRRVTPFEIPRFRIASTAQHLDTMVCDLAYCPISAAPAAQQMGYDFSTHFLARILSIPSN